MGGNDLTIVKTSLTLASLLLLAACDQRSNSNHNAAETSPQNLAPTIGPSPEVASKADQNLIARWLKANDGCVGGIDEKVYKPLCIKRDALQDRLKEHGWCWGLPMDKGAVDDDWHRCGTYDTDNMSNEEALVAKANKYAQQSDAAADDGGSPTAALDPHAGDWYNEQHRIKSPLLQTYENAVEPIAQKIGLANVLTTCDIRGKEWHQQMLAMLNARLHSSTNEEMAYRLTPTDASAAARFKQTVIDGTVKLSIGGQKDAECQSISNMPFAANDRAFGP